MSSIEWSDTQLRILIDERKQRNAEYHATPNKKKQLFWEDIAGKINEEENTNYFTGDDCHKKFLYLTRAFYTAEKYKEGTGTKRSLVGEEIYEEFSRMFWLNPAHNGGNRRSSRASSSSSSAIASRTRTASKIPRAIPSPNVSRSTTPAISKPVTSSTIETPTSRSVTPTIPSFSQNANVINVTINYGGAPEED